MGRPPEFAGFSDLDATGRADEYAGYLDEVRAVDAVAEWKRRSFDLLEPAPGARLLDAGSGTGEDALALVERVLPGGRVTGVDRSAAMVAEARRRCGDAGGALEFLVGDLQHLDLPDAVFDGCRAERTLQHLDDPGRAMGELVRVARPGGRVVAAEPDWGTLVVDSGDDATAGAVAEAAAGALRAPRVGRALRRLMLDAGLEDVIVATRTLVVTDLRRAALVFDIPGATERAVAGGLLAPEVAVRWESALAAADRRGRFFAAMTAFMARGRKP
jgi:SAM-dependent methyltransferase